MTCPKDKQQAFFLLTIIFRKAQQATQVPNLTNLLPIKHIKINIIIQVSQALNCLEDSTMRNHRHTRRRRGCPRIANNNYIPSLEGCT